MCGCNRRRTYSAVTSANLPQPMTTQDNINNAVANATTELPQPEPAKN